MFYDSSKPVAFIPRLDCVTVYPLLTSGNLIFLMNSSISNSLKWLFYLMHFPYSSWTQGVSLGIRGDGPVDGCPVTRTKFPLVRASVRPCRDNRCWGGSHLIVTPLYGEGETDFYSIWMPNDGSRNWPCSHSPSSLGAGQEASLTIGKGRTASAFSKPLSVYLTVKKHKEACWALVPH